VGFLTFFLEFRGVFGPNQIIVLNFLELAIKTLAQFGGIIFCDFKASGISSLRWPYGTISVADEENHTVVCSHCLVITESNDAYDVMLQTATFWVPSLNAKPLAIRTDDLASPDILGKHLSALQLSGLCNFHSRDINLREL
jgi:hypothetical protein